MKLTSHAKNSATIPFVVLITKMSPSKFHFKGKYHQNCRIACETLVKRKIISIIQTETDKIYSYNNSMKNGAGQICVEVKG